MIEVVQEGDLMLRVLDWVLYEQLAGRRATDETVAEHFEITVAQARLLHDKLEAAGEFD